MNAKILLAVVVACALSDSAPAAVFERDWKTPGDGLLTFDDVNQREWLDVPVSLLADFGGFDEVVAETGPNGMFDGFSVARRDDVTALALSAGIDINSTTLADNEVATRHLIDLLGETVNLSGGRVSSTGVLDEFSLSAPAIRLVANFRVTPQIDTASFDVLPFSSLTGDRPLSFVGVMLFRQVPEPSSWLMATMSAAILLLSFRKHRDVTATLQ